MAFRHAAREQEDPAEAAYRQQIVTLVGRVAAAVPRGTPHDLAATAKEWLRHLRPYDVNLDALADVLGATRSWWPSVSDVLQAAVDMTLPARTTEGCCEDGYVQVGAWPTISFQPCRHHTPEAMFQAWAAGDPGWMTAR